MGKIEEVMETYADAPAWVRFRAWQDLGGCGGSNALVKDAKVSMLREPEIQALLEQVQGWPGGLLKSHKDASHILHILVFLADLGLEKSHPVIAETAEKIFSDLDETGMPQLIFQIGMHFGGSGEPQPAWMICDAPLILYALARFGYRDDRRVMLAAARLSSAVQEDGWPCHVSPALGKFRGPGRKSDPCPYATLLMLRLLSEIPGGMESQPFQIGAESLLEFWEARREKKMYLFGMGTDFLKLKAPLVWFDLLHVLDVLSRSPLLRKDPRLHELTGLLQEKMEPEGGFTPESVYRYWKNWDFGQKKQPSFWIRFLAERVLQRMDERE